MVTSIAVPGGLKFKGLSARKQLLKERMLHGTAVIVVDECQNLSSAKSGGAEVLLRFFSDLMHRLGLPLILVGTTAAISILTSQFSQARRATGYTNPVWRRLRADELDWQLLVNALWRYQYTNKKCKLTTDIATALHNLTQGVPDLLAKLLRDVQERAIFGGTEQITSELLHTSASELFGLTKGHLKIMASKKMISDKKLDKCDFLTPQQESRLGKNGFAATRPTTLVKDNGTKKTQNMRGAEQPDAPGKLSTEVDPNPIAVYETIKQAKGSDQTVAKILSKGGFGIASNEFSA
jgi:hypothetical protein